MHQVRSPPDRRLIPPKDDLMQQVNPRPHIFGWGYDLAPENRPGVPKHRHPKRPIGTPHWDEPSLQRTERASLVSPLRPLTPIYASTVPPRGISGALRAYAYRIPEYRPRRWMLLMLADRIDAIEHEPRRLALFVAGLTAVIVGGVALARSRRLPQAADPDRLTPTG